MKSRIVQGWVRISKGKHYPGTGRHTGHVPPSMIRSKLRAEGMPPELVDLTSSSELPGLSLDALSS